LLCGLWAEHLVFPQFFSLRNVEKFGLRVFLCFPATGNKNCFKVSICRAEEWLTFNTTSLPLLRALRDGVLRLRQPLRPVSNDTRRFCIVTPTIAELLDGRLQYGAFPTVEAETLIGRFVAGHALTFSRQITDRRPDVEQIVGQDEVWALCPRRPPPGWRLLGRWFERDVFIALRAWDKHHLVSKYPQACVQVIDDWNGLFPGIEPHRDRDVGDFRNVDEEG
jgi:hypothetical protein